MVVFKFKGVRVLFVKADKGGVEFAKDGRFLAEIFEVSAPNVPMQNSHTIRREVIVR